jgi:hypothetical protein
MSAPVKFSQMDSTGRLWVAVGKSDLLREVEMTDHDRLVLLLALARWAEASL